MNHKLPPNGINIYEQSNYHKNCIPILTFISILSSCSVFSQTESLDNIVGSKYSIQSRILDQEREIQFYLPEGYDETTQSYPVFYVLDGQQYFLNSIAYQKSFRHFERTMAFIVVGIKSYHPQRQILLGRKADQFINFLEQELMGFVDKRFRTSQNRLLFGWQAGGSFVFHVLSKRPDLFDAYFSASGSPTIDLEKLLSEDEMKHEKYLYFTLASSETWATANLESFANLLQERAPKNLKWKYEVFENEDHWSTPYRTIYRGLREIISR